MINIIATLLFLCAGGDGCRLLAMSLLTVVVVIATLIIVAITVSLNTPQPPLLT